MRWNELQHVKKLQRKVGRFKNHGKGSQMLSIIKQLLQRKQLYNVNIKFGT